MHGSRFRFQVPVPVSLYRCIAVRPLQIVLVNFKKVAPKTAPKLLKSCQKIGKVAVKFEKLLLVARIFHGCS